MSLYGKYLKERSNKEILENETGFATYSFPDNTTVYIEDIYTNPESRISGEASRLADEIIKIAKQKGCTKLIGSVVPSTKGSTDSLKVLLAYGMKLDSSTNNFILFSKELV